MFCSECGERAAGKFCTGCGSRLGSTAGAKQGGAIATPCDWDNEVRYEAILAFPGVRATIDRSARESKKRVSGEQFLALAEALVPVPLEKLAGVVQPLYASMGVRTGKERSARVPATVARVVVRALCSFAASGEALRGVTQHDDGCEIEATLPSDLWALEGSLMVYVRRDGAQARVDARTVIPGQMFDWGKSTKRLDRLMEQLGREAA
ncbi:MAG: hypothetical protein ACRCT8_01160 [Lacipirellulaceae bacterium]